MTQKPLDPSSPPGVPEFIRRELQESREWIQKFRLGQIGEVKMQKIRLQLGTYAQRQDGVQMERIKFPGGVISSDQLLKLADVADRYASGFIHFTTREDAQLYYIKLEECPDMMLDLASTGITTREACGNTVRNITACYRSGVSATEVFDVVPYTEALFRFLVRNKFNQVMGRKFKIAFEGCEEDHAGMRFHDMGFKAVVRKEGGRLRRGFRTYLGGGLGGTPMLGFLYSEFLPEEGLMNLAAATVRLFDRYGERKNRMAARMKFLVKKLGWDKFKAALDEELKQVRLPASTNDYLKEAWKEKTAPPIPPELAKSSDKSHAHPGDEDWLHDNVVNHKFPGYKGVNVRLKLGDLVTAKARTLAEIARIFSRAELRITIEQNLFLPWVPEVSLPALYEALSEAGLAEAGVETMEDATTCPGSDTCRLGITSAKGLGAGIAEALHNGLSRYKEISRDIRIKISGCPNGCAQHGVAHIGFQGAALAKDGKTLPAHELFLGGSTALDQTAFGERIGKFPARNCIRVVEKLLELYAGERREGESFNACMTRVGKDRVRQLLAPLAEAPSFDQDPEFYKDWGHENEGFAIRTGIKGECAGAPVQEKTPQISTAKERLAQAEAFLIHQEFGNAQKDAYEAMAEAVRVPLYAVLVDPFTSEQALWEFENIFVRSGRSNAEWLDLSDRVRAERDAPPSEARAQVLITSARKLTLECERLHAEILNSHPQKPMEGPQISQG